MRALARRADAIFSSTVAIAEMACVAHRKIREGQTTKEQAAIRQDLFWDDVRTGVIHLLPVTESLLRIIEKSVRELPADCFLRAYDAVHLASASANGFTEIWSNDRHLLAAANHFGLVGRSV